MYTVVVASSLKLVLEIASLDDIKIENALAHLESGVGFFVLGFFFVLVFFD